MSQKESGLNIGRITEVVTGNFFPAEERAKIASLYLGKMLYNREQRHAVQNHLSAVFEGREANDVSQTAKRLHFFLTIKPEVFSGLTSPLDILNSIADRNQIDYKTLISEEVNRLATILTTNHDQAEEGYVLAYLHSDQWIDGVSRNYLWNNSLVRALAFELDLKRSVASADNMANVRLGDYLEDDELNDNFPFSVLIERGKNFIADTNKLIAHFEDDLIPILTEAGVSLAVWKEPKLNSDEVLKGLEPGMPARFILNCFGSAEGLGIFKNPLTIAQYLLDRFTKLQTDTLSKPDVVSSMAKLNGLLANSEFKKSKSMDKVEEKTRFELTKMLVTLRAEESREYGLTPHLHDLITMAFYDSFEDRNNFEPSEWLPLYKYLGNKLAGKSDLEKESALFAVGRFLSEFRGRRIEYEFLDITLNDQTVMGFANVVRDSYLQCRNLLIHKPSDGDKSSMAVYNQKYDFYKTTQKNAEKLMQGDIKKLRK